jgi:choline dehydrogenase-like flavoprotein
MGLTSKQPNIEFFSTECYGGPKQYVDFPDGEKSHAFSLIAELFAPKSRGCITLKSADPKDNPIVDHKYLSEELDVVVLSEACKFANEIITQGKGTKDIFDGSWPAELTHHKHTKREEWVPFVRDNATTCYHPGGTCKMGTDNDPMAVLDNELRVRGVRGLRVADTSVMPLLNQGHTQMPAYAIGEKAADLIKGKSSQLNYLAQQVPH